MGCLKTSPPKRDGRSIDRKTLEEMRRLAVRRVLAGEEQAEVARSLEVNRTTVVRWMMAYRDRGAEGLANGKPTGRPPTLTATQQKRLLSVIVSKNPRQLGFGMALWTLPLVRAAIEKLFGIALHETTVMRLLRKLGLTPQKPVRRAFQRDDAEVRRWVAEDFPAIVRDVERKQATLLFLDETGVHENGPIGTTWGLRGRRPVVRVTGTRKRVNVISAISPRGRLWFRCFRGNLNAPSFVAFLEALLEDFRGDLVLVLDRHPAHVAAVTRRWLLEHRRLTVHYLPGYAPELNADEHVWAQLKGMFRRDPLDKFEDLETAVDQSMAELSANRKLLRSLFDHPDLEYVRNALKWSAAK
jgi:transposase